MLELTSGFIPVFSAIWFDVVLGLAGCDAPRAVFLCGFLDLMRCIMAGIGPEGGLRRAVQNTAENLQLQFIKVVFLSVVMQRRIPWSHRP